MAGVESQVPPVGGVVVVVVVVGLLAKLAKLAAALGEVAEERLLTDVAEDFSATIVL